MTNEEIDSIIEQATESLNIAIGYKKALHRIANFSIKDSAFSKDDYENMLMMMAIAQEALEPSILDYSSEKKE